jgi:hypothetical protein
MVAYTTQLDLLRDDLSRLIHSERPLHDPLGTDAVLRAVLLAAYRLGVDDGTAAADYATNEAGERAWAAEDYEPRGTP